MQTSNGHPLDLNDPGQRGNAAPATNASDLAALAGYVVRLYQQHGQAPDGLLALSDGVPLPPALPARNGEQLF